jgi:hypothetical protein
MNAFTKRKCIPWLNTHLYNITRKYSEANNQSKEDMNVAVEELAVRQTTAANPWVIQKGEASTSLFQLAEIAYLDKYFSPILRSNNISRSF